MTSYLILILILFFCICVICGLIGYVICLKINNLNDLLNNNNNAILKELELSKKYSKERTILLKKIEVDTKINTQKWLDLEVSIGSSPQSVNKGF